MRFSLFYNFDLLPEQGESDAYREIEAQVIAADLLGFDAIWLAKPRSGSYRPIPSSLLYLAHISGLTRQLALGIVIGGALAFPPEHLAEDLLSLTRLVDDRLHLGIAENASETDTFCPVEITPVEKLEGMQEITEFMLQTLKKRRINFNVHSQTPSQLLWLVTHRSLSQAAGEHGYGILIPRTGESVWHQRLIATYRQALAGKRGNVSLLRFVFVAETLEEAREQTRLALIRFAHDDLGFTWDGNTKAPGYSELLRRLNIILGTPEQVVEQLRILQEMLSFEEIMCQAHVAGLQPEAELRSIELLGREVMPKLQFMPPASAQPGTYERQQNNNVAKRYDVYHEPYSSLLLSRPKAGTRKRV